MMAEGVAVVGTMNKAWVAAITAPLADWLVGLAADACGTDPVIAHTGQCATWHWCHWLSGWSPLRPESDAPPPPTYPAKWERDMQDPQSSVARPASALLSRYLSC